MAVHMKDKDGPYDAAEAYNALSSDGPPAIPPSSSYSTLNVGNRDSQILMRNGIGSPTTPNHHVDITEPINSHKSNKKKNNLISSPINGSTNANEKESRAREVTLSSSRTRSSRFSRAESWVPSRTASLFLITIITEAAIVIALVSTVFAKILIHTRSDDRVQDLKTNAVYFSLIIFGMVFLVGCALDAHRLKNTIQVIGVTIFNIAMIVVAALEIPQVHKALRLQDESGAGIKCPNDPGAICSGTRDLFPTSQRYLIVVTVLIGVAQFPITLFCYHLWSEWGWRIYKVIGADVELRRQYFCYQILVVLLKFDFFFGLGFSMSYLILIADQSRWQFPVNIAALPLAVLILFFCAIAVRKEWTALMLLSILGFIAGELYFVYQLTRIYASSTAYLYETVRLTLTFFSVFAILFLFLTLINSIICLSNFGRGLREAHASIGHVVQPRPKMDHDSIDAIPPVQLEDATLRRPASDAFGASRLSLD